MPASYPIACLALSGLLLAATGRAVEYEKEIKPVLKARCYACHGALKQKAGLRLDTVAAIKSGGDNGDATKLLLERITTTDKHDQMPPEGEGSRLNALEVTLMKSWLAAGAPGPAAEQPEPDPRSHWAYQPPKPSGRSLDSLITARLALKQLKPQPAAAPEVWLRRVYIDLTGLPPDAEEVEAFAADAARSDAIYGQTVDRLLASAQYGERWGRHFMDIWRYCDWYGLGAQLRHSQKHIWHWRDWIIESLNADKGYDEMIVQMLAADELAPEDRDNLRATGFLARSYYLFNRTTWLDETIEHTCRAFLGVTMQCVKCHDHKYDPIEQSEYYRMRAVFEPLHVRLDPWPGEPDLEKNGLPRVFDLHLDQPTYRHVRGDEKNEDKTRLMQPGIPAVLAFASFAPEKILLPAAATHPVTLPFVFSDHLHNAAREITDSSASHDGVALHLAQMRLHMLQAAYAADTRRNDPVLVKTAAAAAAAYREAKAAANLAELLRTPAPAGADKRKAHDKKIADARTALDKARQAVASPGSTYESIQASLKAQEGPDDKTSETVQSYPGTSTGRRLAFARWIADTRNPLTARVLVNHVWTRHFGASLVPDVGDFGRRCPEPLHRDVLDTLAADFMTHGWSLKRLHREMVLSDVYRRSSSNAGADARTLASDPDNLCYWRMNPRRLESQAVRDCLLSLAGTIDLAQGGPSLDPEKSGTSRRRSLYFTQNADIEHAFLATFDNANVLECYRRNESVVPQQALALTNSKLSSDCANALAASMQSLEDTAFLERSFLTVLGRPPVAAELDAARTGLAAMGSERSLFIQALLSHNDFVTLR